MWGVLFVLVSRRGIVERDPRNRRQSGSNFASGSVEKGELPDGMVHELAATVETPFVPSSGLLLTVDRTISERRL